MAIKTVTKTKVRTKTIALFGAAALTASFAIIGVASTYRNVPTAPFPKTAGYVSGYTPGYTSGYTPGYTSGYTPGYTSGYTPGYTSGYTPGYVRGW